MRNGSCRHVLSVRRPCPLALPGVIRKHPSHHDMLRPLCNHCVVMLRPLWRPPRGPYNGLNSAIFETFYKVVLQWPLHGLYMAFTRPRVVLQWPLHGLYMAFTWPLHPPEWPLHGPYMAFSWPLHGLYTPQSGFTVAFTWPFTGALQNWTKRPLPNNS